jgi:hypothetical protein
MPPAPLHGAARHDGNASHNAIERIPEAAGIPRPNWVEFRFGEHGASPAELSQGIVPERLTVSLPQKIR